MIWCAVGLSMVAATASACASKATGPRRTVCGTHIGQADQNSATWFYDATKDAPTVQLAAPAPQSGAWVQLTHDCSLGVQLHIANGSIVRIDESVLASDGNDVAVRLTSLSTGSTTITVSSTGHAARTLTVQVDASTH
jgi:hypothetical protein